MGQTSTGQTTAPTQSSPGQPGIPAFSQAAMMAHQGGPNAMQNASAVSNAAAMAAHQGGPNAMLNAAQQPPQTASPAGPQPNPSPAEQAAFQQWQSGNGAPPQWQPQSDVSAQQAALHQAAYAQLAQWQASQGGGSQPSGQQGFVNGPQPVGQWGSGNSWANPTPAAPPMTAPLAPQMNFSQPPPVAAPVDTGPNLFAQQNQKIADAAAAAKAQADALQQGASAPLPVISNDAGSQ